MITPQDIRNFDDAKLQVFLSTLEAIKDELTCYTDAKSIDGAVIAILVQDLTNLLECKVETP